MLSPKTSSPADLPSAGGPRGHWFWNAYLQISISILLTTASQIFMKLGADRSIHDEWLGFAGLRSGWVWLGIIAMIAGLVSWLHALKTVPLNIAFSLACASHALVPLSCWIFLGEAIPGRRWLGIALVIAGIAVIARPLVHLEEKL